MHSIHTYRDKNTHTLICCLAVYFSCLVGWKKKDWFLCIVDIQVFLVPYTQTKPNRFTLPSFCIANHVFCYKIELAHTMPKLCLHTKSFMWENIFACFQLFRNWTDPLVYTVSGLINTFYWLRFSDCAANLQWWAAIHVCNISPNFSRLR